MNGIEALVLCRHSCPQPEQRETAPAVAANGHSDRVVEPDEQVFLTGFLAAAGAAESRARKSLR